MKFHDLPAAARIALAGANSLTHSAFNLMIEHRSPIAEEIYEDALAHFGDVCQALKILPEEALHHL